MASQLTPIRVPPSDRRLLVLIARHGPVSNRDLQVISAQTPSALRAATWRLRDKALIERAGDTPVRWRATFTGRQLANVLHSNTPHLTPDPARDAAIAQIAGVAYKAKMAVYGRSEAHRWLHTRVLGYRLRTDSGPLEVPMPDLLLGADQTQALVAVEAWTTPPHTRDWKAYLATYSALEVRSLHLVTGDPTFAKPVLRVQSAIPAITVTTSCIQATR